MAPELSVVIPLYNEEGTVEELHRRLDAVLRKEPLAGFEIVLIDDGSNDDTADCIERIAARSPNVVAIRLSRNFGHQAAVCAGIDHATGGAVILMDGDLQDPPEVLPEFIRLWRNGVEVVYAIRQRRKEGPFMRLAYFMFYRLLRAISDIGIPLDSGDFCLMDRKVVDALKSLPERMRFVRGLRSYVGFRQVGLAYERMARHAGEPKYTFRKLVGLAADGLVSFSGSPLRLVTKLGLASTLFAVVLAAWVLFDAFVNRTGPRGWASMVVIVLFMSAIQLISLGILGEYIRLIFLEAKQRPAYIVRSIRRGEVDAPRGGDVTWSRHSIDEAPSSEPVVPSR
jgi:dolichol-phosphate mannosyltransferase